MYIRVRREAGANFLVIWWKFYEVEFVGKLVEFQFIFNEAFTVPASPAFNVML